MADTTDDTSEELGRRSLPTQARKGLVAVGELGAVIDPQATLSSQVIRAQVRSMVVDLLMLTGLPGAEAPTMVPDTQSAAEVSGRD